MPQCELCGALVQDPCTTDTEQQKCELPDFCFPKSEIKPERPWSGDLSCDLRNSTLHIVTDAMVVIDGHGTAWATVLPDGGGFYYHAAFIVKAVNNHEAIVKALEQTKEYLTSDALYFAPDHILKQINAVLRNLAGAK